MPVRFRQFMFVIAAFLLIALPVPAQIQSDDAIAKNRWNIPSRPYNCEMNLQHLEDVRNMLRGQANPKGVLIILARLGDGEKRNGLNRRRLNNVREGLIQTLGIESERIVIGEGERVRGYGRVEFYLGGEMVGALLVNRNASVIKCEF